MLSSTLYLPAQQPVSGFTKEARWCNLQPPAVHLTSSARWRRQAMPHTERGAFHSNTHADPGDHAASAWCAELLPHNVFVPLLALSQNPVVHSDGLHSAVECIKYSTAEMHLLSLTATPSADVGAIKTLWCTEGQSNRIGIEAPLCCSKWGACADLQQGSALWRFPQTEEISGFGVP